MSRKPPLYHRTNLTPEVFFGAWSRRDLEVLIEMLIESLDAADGDANLEPDLGSGLYGGDDREDDSADAEPSLGWAESESVRGECATALPTWSPDVELDECDDEDGDASGIGDLDGLREVVGGGCVAYV